MDKPRDVNRGANRFSTAKRHKLFHGFDSIGKNFKFSEKSKRKVKSLSAVGRALSSYEDSGMGCDISENNDALPVQSPSSNIIASKRFKVPKKFRESYVQCGYIRPAAPSSRKVLFIVAMKKRNRESALLDPEKVSHTMNGIASAQKYGIKKSRKQGSTDWSPRPTVSGPITKDEAEVVETLNALARIFPNNCSNKKNELVGESLPENSSVLQELPARTNTAFEDSGAARDANPSFAQKSPVEVTKTTSSSDTVIQEQPDWPEGASFLMAFDCIASKLNQQNMPMLVGSENAREVALQDSELCLAMGLNKPRQSPISHMEKAMGNDECKQVQLMIKDPEQHGMLHAEGSALWPGLSPLASAGSRASYLQSSAAKDPVWVEAAICTSKQDLMKSNSSGGRISKVVTHKRPWKRCAAHVQIGHLIQSLQGLNNEEMSLQQYGAPKEVHDLKRIMRNEITFAPVTGHPATTKNCHETKNGILQRRYLDKSQAAPTPGVFVPQKQRFGYLSLSAGCELEITNSSNKVGGRLEPFPKVQVPCFHSLAQRHDGLTSLSMPRSQYAPTSYLEHPSVTAPQVKLQLPHYYSSPLRGTHGNWKAPKKQEHQSQGFWAVQVGDGGRPAVTCHTMRTQYPNWQSRRRDSSGVSPCPQKILPHSTASLQALGSKIIPISGQQQHQFVALSSPLPPSRTNGLHFLPPSARLFP